MKLAKLNANIKKAFGSGVKWEQIKKRCTN